MERYDVNEFNQQMRMITKKFAICIYQMLKEIKINMVNGIIVKQPVKSSSSVAANFSSASRGRSEAEFYSKICIVVEECDESLFWLNFLMEAGEISCEPGILLKTEAEELLKIFSTIRRKLKVKRTPIPP